VSIKESLNHAEVGVVQLESKVQRLLDRLADPCEDPVDLQSAARECACEIEVVGSSLITPEFAEFSHLACSVLSQSPPEWMTYEGFHDRLHNAFVVVEGARTQIRGLCRALSSRTD